MDANNARRALVDKLIELGTKATKPGADAATQKASQQDFDQLIQATPTSALIQTLTFLIQPGRLPPQLTAKLLEVLTRIPLRPDGVRATAEFVFSVHPSSTVSSSEEAAPQKNGANITQEALNMAAKMIAYPPASFAQDVWYRTIAPQLYGLLDGEEGPELMKVAAYVIGFGILGRKQSGALGELRISLSIPNTEANGTQAQLDGRPLQSQCSSRSTHHLVLCPAMCWAVVKSPMRLWI